MEKYNTKLHAQNLLQLQTNNHSYDVTKILLIKYKCFNAQKQMYLQFDNDLIANIRKKVYFKLAIASKLVKIVI